MDKNVKIGIIVIVIIVALTIVVLAKSSGVLFGPTTQCDDKIDNDGDGRCDYGPNTRCSDGSISGDSGCSGKTDNTECNSAPEICDDIDNDCDGLIDEGLGSTTCGVEACQRTIQNCISGQPQTCAPGTSVTEICGCGIDDDCDGFVDEMCNLASCTDSDGGINLIIKGIVTGYNDFGTPFNYTDSCVNSSAVNEQFCTGVLASAWKKACPVGTTCSDGACISIPDSCSDSDGGQIYTIKGTVTGFYQNQSFSNTDFCNGNYLTEYYCWNNGQLNRMINCDQPGNFTSCTSGACA